MGKKFMVFVFVLMIVLASAFSTNVVLQLKWFNQFQFAGFYTALEKGYYSAEGLNVTIKQGGPSVSPLRSVLTNEAQFGIEGSNIIQAATAGKKIKAVMVILQQEPVCFLSMKDSGITKPSDFKGKVLGSAGFAYLETKLMLKEGNVSKRDVKFKRWNYNMNEFYKGDFDVIPAYITNEPDLAKSAGYEVNIIKPSDYGIKFFGDTLFVSENYLKNNPDIVRKFVEASYKGWFYAITHQEEIVNLILAKYNTQHLSKSHLLYEAKEITKLALYGLHDKKSIGTFNLNIWSKDADIMYEYGISKRKANLQNLIYDKYIKEVAK